MWIEVQGSTQRINLTKETTATEGTCARPPNRVLGRSSSCHWHARFELSGSCDSGSKTQGSTLAHGGLMINGSLGSFRVYYVKSNRLLDYYVPELGSECKAVGQVRMG